MRTILFAAVVAVLVSSASAVPAADIDWNSPDVVTGDADEIELPPGTWCLVMRVRNNVGEPATLIYQRGIDCDPEDRVVIEPANVKRNR
jgi:hypothetical protein